MSAEPLFAMCVWQQRRRGFTLVELMVVIAIVAILAILALPSYRSTIQSNRTGTDANNFVAAINLTREEAVTRSRPVTLCASADGTTCAGDATSWTNKRWIAFTDYGAQGIVDGGDVVVRMWDGINTQDQLTSDQPVRWISFDRSGHASTDNVTGVNSASPAEVVFTLRPRDCAANVQSQRTITFQMLGRASVVTGTCS